MNEPLPQPDASVVIPLYNRRSLIEYTIDSLRADHHAGVSLEVLVVDDGSTDGGADLVEARFPWVTVCRQSQQGAPAARNRGIALASAPAVLLLDSDDLIEPGYFIPRLEALTANRDAAGAYGRWDVFEGGGPFRSRDIRPRHSPYPVIPTVEVETHLINVLRGWYLAPSTILWRTKRVREVGGHDPDLVINQDVDFLFRILLTAGLVGVDGPRALARDHNGPRQGRVSADRLAHMLALRQHFRAELASRGLLSERHRRALAEYAFDIWAEFRSVAPEGADAFLEFSRELWPEVVVRGGWMFRALGSLVGAANATVLKQGIDRFLRASRAEPHSKNSA